LRREIVVKKLFPTRAIALLMAIGFLDLIVTAVLHAQGRIVELNPIMRMLIERSEWLFALGKGLTLVAGWWALANYAKNNLQFVRKTSLFASAAYVTIWICWFVGGMLTPPAPEEPAHSVEIISVQNEVKQAPTEV
jgi:hypothetical protein